MFDSNGGTKRTSGPDPHCCHAILTPSASAKQISGTSTETVSQTPNPGIVAVGEVGPPCRWTAEPGEPRYRCSSGSLPQTSGDERSNLGSAPRATGVARHLGSLRRGDRTACRYASL